MFQWLAKMLMKTPVGSSCSCCEGRNRQLEKMRREVMGDNEPLPLEIADTKAENIGFSTCSSCFVRVKEVHYRK